MSIFASGAISPREAVEYVCAQPKIESLLFGASSRANIENSVALIREYDEKFGHAAPEGAAAQG